MPSVTPRVRIPTADDLCTEGFRMVAGREPAGDELDRAVKFWLEDVLDDIWTAATRDDTVRYKLLENTSVLLLTKGQRRYDWPDDFHRPICISMLEGTIEGEVVSAADSAATGLSGATPADGTEYLPAENTGDLEDYFAGTAPFYDLSGLYVVMTDGDAEGVMRQVVSVTDYLIPGSVHVFKLDDVWVDPEIPAEDDTFMIAETVWEELVEDMRDHMDRATTRAGIGKPTSFNEFDRGLELDVAPDSDSYAIVVRYWANPLKIDKESTIFETLCTNWRSTLTKGITAYAARALDDTRAEKFRAEFLQNVEFLINKEYDRGPQLRGIYPAR